MASVTKRGTKWQYRVSWRDEAGNPHSKNKGGFRTKVEATNAAREVELLRARGGSFDKADMPLVDYWHEWYTTYKQEKARSTSVRYVQVEDTLRAHFGETPIGKVTALDWQKFLNDYATGKYRSTEAKKVLHPKPLAKETVNKLNGYVRSMVKYALNDQVLHSDFTFGAYVPGRPPKDESSKYLQADQFDMLMNRAYQQATFTRLSSVAIFVAGQSGMRLSEILALTWDDVDFKHHTLSVDKSWDYVVNKFKPTKTPSSVRKVEVLPIVTALLAKIRVEQTEWMLKSGTRDANNCIFYSKLGVVITQAACAKALKKLQQTVGVPIDRQITFHGLRHTHVSYLLAHGVDIYYISKRLGHANIQITLKVYSHLLEDQRKAQAEKTLDVLSGIVVGK